MRTNIKAVGKQVKKAAQEGQRGELARRARLAGVPVAVLLDDELDESARVAWRARELRDIATRLRDEAMLVDVAAAAEEERSRKLARKSSRQRKPSAPPQQTAAVAAS